jgi:predicted dinucleotide-binding enzyme
MRIGILGTGPVGQALGACWVGLGHDVVLGSRRPDNDSAVAWAAANGSRATSGTFKTAAASADLVVNATAGQNSIAALTMAADELPGKVILDVANALDFSHGSRRRWRSVQATAWRRRSSGLFPTFGWSRR